MDFEGQIEYMPHIHTDSCYELELWQRDDIKEMDYTKESVKEELESQGRIFANDSFFSIGLYPNKQRALEAMGEEFETAYDNGIHIPFCFLRQIPAHVQMDGRGEYVQESLYEGCLLKDVSLVRNFNTDYYKFQGRPEEKIRFKVGDIVKVADGAITYWAVIYGLPPTPELVSKNFDYVAVSGRRFLNKEEMEAKSVLDYSDDCYTVLTNYECHQHILAHRVINAFSIPDIIKETLEDVFVKTKAAWEAY